VFLLIITVPITMITLRENSPAVFTSTCAGPCSSWLPNALNRWGGEAVAYYFGYVVDEGEGLGVDVFYYFGGAG